MIKILAFCPIKADGTSFYRGLGPLNHLKKFYDIDVTDASPENLEISWDLLLQYDLLFFQRPSMITDIYTMELAQACNRPIWIDYDDDYISIPKTNPRYGLYADPHRLQQVLKAIEYADIITTSTISLKESIAEKTGKDRSRIQVIPNAIDETVFDVSLIERLPDNKIILWRGGDTHDQDMKVYLDKMVDLYNEFPEYKWAFMGHAPQEMLKKIDTGRILLYPFDELMKYFDYLFELKPTITLVPWEENDFNRSKSNSSWLESTLVGAPTVFPSWSAEFVEGMAGYNDPESFYKKAFSLLCAAPARKSLYEKSQEILSSRFTLGALASTRINIIHQLMEERINMGKLGINHPKYNVKPVQYNDKQFSNYAWQRCYNQDYPPYNDAHRGVAKWLYETYKPQRVVELGCGPGPMVEMFCDLKVRQVAGFDTNPHFKEYFDKRNPHYTQNFYQASFLEAELSGVFDLCVSIECFEHIPHETLMPFIEKMADHFKVLYFTSTPYRTSQKFDSEWGHCNLKTHEAWIKLFEANGFKYMGNPKKIVIWDALFHSTRADENKALKEEHIDQ